MTKSITFHGEVQLRASRRDILEHIYQTGLAGWIGNSQHDKNQVFAVLAGPEKKMSTFTRVCEEHICESGVEMKVHESPISTEVLPLPAVRLPDSGMDIADRFDKAIDLLSAMNDNLVSMNENLVKINAKLDMMNDKLDMMNDKLDQHGVILNEINGNTKLLVEKLL